MKHGFYKWFEYRIIIRTKMCKSTCFSRLHLWHCVVSCICHSYTQTSWIFLWKCTTGKFMVYFCSLFSGQNNYIYNYSLHWDMIIITLLVVIWINFFRVIYVGHYEIKVQPSFCDTFEYLNDNICQKYCISRYIDIMFYSCIIRSILKK